MRASRRLGGVVTAAAVAVTPSPAFAEPAEPTPYLCRTPLGAFSTQVSLALTAPSTARAGETVMVRLTGTAGALRRITAPPPDDPPEAPGAPGAEIAVSGAQEGSLVADVERTEPVTDIRRLKLPTWAASLTLTSPGKVALMPTGFAVETPAGKVSCVPEKPQQDPAVIQVLADTTPAAPTASQNLKLSKTWARRADWLTFTGSGWHPSQPAIGWLCDANRRGCRILGYPSVGYTDRTGKLTGWGWVGWWAPAGQRTIRVSTFHGSAYAPLRVLGDRRVTLKPSHGPAGTQVSVSGIDFTPGMAARVQGLTRDGKPNFDAAVPVHVEDDGTVRTTLTVNDPNTKAIVIAEQGGGRAQAAYAVTDANGLRLDQRAGETTLGAVPVSTVLQHARGELAPLKVTDLRGGPSGWSLVATLTDFKGSPTGSIPAGQLHWTPSCKPAAGGPYPGKVTPGPAKPLGAAPSALCQQAADPTGKATGGVFDAGAALDLQVPPGTPAGSYTAQLTLTLS